MLHNAAVVTACKQASPLAVLACQRSTRLLSTFPNLLPWWGALADFSKGEIEVCCIDPRTVLQHHKWKEQGELQQHAAEEMYTPVVVPKQLVPALSKGQNELGDMDDPMNNWYFGKKDEIFRYRLIGTHLTQSGFSSIIRRDRLQQIYDGDVAGLPSWEEFQKAYQRGLSFPSMRHPFLFAGLMVETSEAAVYKLEQEGKVAGLLISSEAMGA